MVLLRAGEVVEGGGEAHGGAEVVGPVGAVGRAIERAAAAGDLVVVTVPQSAMPVVSAALLLRTGLDARQRVRLVREVALGTTAGVEVQPREVFRPLVRAASHSVLLVHNHPGGELRPSAADLKLTQRLVELGELLGIPVLDHLIVTDEGMCSLAGLGLLPLPREET